MTAKQKANQERFKKVVAEAKKLRKKNPKLTQAQAVKQAWAISYTKKRTKKAVGVTKKRKTVTGERHKDTNSHNVKISVMSGSHTYNYDCLNIYRRYSPHKSSATLNGKKITIKKAETLLKSGLYKYYNQIGWSYGVDVFYRKSK